MLEVPYAVLANAVRCMGSCRGRITAQDLFRRPGLLFGAGGASYRHRLSVCSHRPDTEPHSGGRPCRRIRLPSQRLPASPPARAAASPCLQSGSGHRADLLHRRCGPLRHHVAVRCTRRTSGRVLLPGQGAEPFCHRIARAALGDRERTPPRRADRAGFGRADGAAARRHHARLRHVPASV